MYHEREKMLITAMPTASLRAQEIIKKSSYVLVLADKNQSGAFDNIFLITQSKLCAHLQNIPTFT